jgi:gliding motility-associated-like protein
LYNGDIGAGKFALTKDGYKVQKYNEASYSAIMENLHFHNKKGTAKTKPNNTPINGHMWEVKFLNANKNFKVKTAKQQQAFSNYFLGNDPTKWGEGCRAFTEISYENIYNNIDINYYTNNGVLKYDLIVKPGANVNDIQFKYEGITDIKKERNGELSLETSVGRFKELSPLTFQIIDNQKKKVNCRYKIKNNILSFDLDEYDKTQTLVIDPTLVFSTFSLSRSDNFGFTATYGSDQTFYGGAIIFGSKFQATPGAFQTTYGEGSYDIGISKLSPDGSTLIYSTYIGGSGNDQPHSLIVDGNGNLVVAGRTNSSNYPITVPAFGPRGGYDIVLTKLNATGSALVGSMLICGSGDDGANITSGKNGRNSLQYNYGDDARSEVNIDAQGNIILASCTQSSNFYKAGDVIQPSFGGGQDAVFIKANANLNSVLFSSYYGGSNNDAAYVVSLNPITSDYYFAGGTESDNLLGNKTGVIQPTKANLADGFITVLSNDCKVIRQMTYLGTSSYDQIYGIQFDKLGFPYVMGISLGNWPVVNAAFSNPGSHQFVAKLKKDLSNYEYATKFGANTALTNISPVAFLVDKCENVYVSGWGGSSDQYLNDGTFSMPITSDAFQNTTDGSDFYYFVLKKNAESQLFGSYFGRVQPPERFGEHVDGGTSRFDPRGIIYQAACAGCAGTRFPVTPGSLNINNATDGNGCNLGMTKIRFEYTGVGADVIGTDSLGNIDTTGCVPLTVYFKDIVLNAVRYEYDFGDGSPLFTTTSQAPVPHVYNNLGTYRVRLVAFDPSTCNLSDTSYINVNVRDGKAPVDFTSLKLPPCENLTYRFDNTTIQPIGKPPFTNKSFTWDFGGASPRVTTGTASQTITFPAAGVYTVRLIINDTNYCNSPDSIQKIIRVSPIVKADFPLTNGCAPYTFKFQNTSLGGIDFEWDFNDGGPLSNEVNPTRTFTNPGTYKIKLTSTDTNSCNKVSVIEKTLVVYPVPTAAFTFAPQPSLRNTPTTYTNNSTGAVKYKWLFGDGDSSTAVNPIYQFNYTDSFNTCLIAINEFGCEDIFCDIVPAFVDPLFDITTAFTPNGDGNNDFAVVRGFGIKTILFRIYNRWGQIVFETNQRKIGWDGKYKGVLQPMDAYAYTLSIENSDGKKFSKSGNITLIR